VTGEAFPKGEDDAQGLRADDWNLLREVCGDDRVFFDVQVALLGVERQFRGMSRRAGVFEVLEEKLRTGLYGSEEEAVAVLKERKEREKKLHQDVGDAKMAGTDSPAPEVKDDA